MRRPGRLAAAAALAASAFAAQAQEAERRGPFETREEWLLAQPRLQLAPRSADPLPVGRSELRADLDWGNDFGLQPGDYFVDGEHATLGLTARRGVRERLTLGARVSLQWRGGGVLDHVIDWWHRVTHLPNNGRPLYPRDRFLVTAVGASGAPLAFTGEPGSGLGKLELEALVGLLRRPEQRLALSLAGVVALPTGTGAFGGGGPEAGVQLLAARGLGRRVDLHAGLGLVGSGEAERDGFSYPRARVYAHLAFEWRAFASTSLLAQADGAGRLLTGIRGYPSLQSYVRLGAKRDFGSRTRAEVGFSENLARQEATTDFGVFFGVTRRLGR